jgi:hypothetical protein
MSNTHTGGRREFLTSALAAAAAPLLVPARALGRGATAPSDRVTVGIIGSGGRAVFETRQYPSFDNAEIVAVCDAQESRRQSAKDVLEKQYADVRPGTTHRGIRTYLDFHELLDRKDIDGVYIASPDHWHVSMLIPSLAAGKHVHCEKPLGVSVEQDLAARNAARRYSKQAFLYGAESRCNPDARKAAELVLNGRIGEVRKIYVLAPPSVAGGSDRPEIPIPAGFDYDRWLGPAPVHPFSADRCLTDEPRSIFNLSDYTLGNIANWAAHPLDQMQRWADAAGRKDPPVLYEGAGKFPAAGLFDTAIQWNVRCTWADGLVLDFMDCDTYATLPDAPHPSVQDWGIGKFEKLPNGVIFVGSEGWICISYTGVAASNPALLNSAIGPNEIHLPDASLASVPADLPKGYQQKLTAAHHQNWIKAIRTGAPTVDGIESAFRSDMISQLAELCIRSGHPVRWDPEKETIIGNEMARMMMRRPMRSPWGVA